ETDAESGTAPGGIPHRLPSLQPSILPSTPSAAAPRGFVRALRWYYEARPTPRLFHGSFGSSPSRRGPGSQCATAGHTRSPRFRRRLFARDGIFDHGRATAPRMTAPHILPSTIPSASAPAIFWLSQLNGPPQRNCCVRFATAVTNSHATLATGRPLRPTRTGLSPARQRQLPGAQEIQANPKGGAHCAKAPFGLPAISHRGTLSLERDAKEARDHDGYRRKSGYYR